MKRVREGYVGRSDERVERGRSKNVHSNKTVEILRRAVERGVWGGVMRGKRGEKQARS